MITQSREASDPSNRRYHVAMLLLEIKGAMPDRKGDTRGYVSVDMPEAQILTELLEAEAERLKDAHHPALDK